MQTRIDLPLPASLAATTETGQHQARLRDLLSGSNQGRQMLREQDAAARNAQTTQFAGSGVQQLTPTDLENVYRVAPALKSQGDVSRVLEMIRSASTSGGGHFAQQQQLETLRQACKMLGYRAPTSVYGG